MTEQEAKSMTPLQGHSAPSKKEEMANYNLQLPDWVGVKLQSNDPEIEMMGGDVLDTEISKIVKELQIVTDLKKELREFLNDLKMKMRENRLLSKTAPYFEMPLKLLNSLCHFIWDMDLLKADTVICSRVYRHFQQDYFQMAPKQSDLDEYLEFKPVEVISAKCGQIFIKMISGAVDLAFSEVGNLEKLLSDQRITRDNENLQGFLFLANTLKLTLNVLADIELPKEDEIPNFDDLNIRSQCVVNGAKFYFMKALRYKQTERLSLLKHLVETDNTTAEWLVTYCEVLRRKRRESVTGKAKRAAPEESEMITTALVMGKENPFVIMGLIDFMVDHVRDSKGRFHVADMDYDSQGDIMKSFQDYCDYIIQEYPRNVSFISIISDYYLRYVPFAYFDVIYGGKLLSKAHRLNPENPKTTHRLGIYYRMSREDIENSYSWFLTTIKLDPTHFNAVMEYYKTSIGKFAYRETAQAMSSKLNSDECGCWTEIEVYDFKFLLSLTYFALGDKERALEMWAEIVQKNQIIFRLQVRAPVSLSCHIYFDLIFPTFMFVILCVVQSTNCNVCSKEMVTILFKLKILNVHLIMSIPVIFIIKRI